jgi:hypothetical protein
VQKGLRYLRGEPGEIRVVGPARIAGKASTVPPNYRILVGMVKKTTDRTSNFKFILPQHDLDAYCF